MRLIPLLCAGLVACATAPTPSPLPVFPASGWQQAASPEAEGYSSDKLEMVRTFVGDLDTTGLMVVVHGHVLLAMGDVTRPNVIASVRKSVLGVLLGSHVARGEVRLDSTLAELGIDDVGGLSAAEREATVADLMAARSGVYHPASNPGDDLRHAPARGSRAHGAAFLYSNWDFNALGTVFERQTHKDIYDALDRELAQPLGMQDFQRAEQRKSHADAVSIHPAYHMRLSTRDLARVGHLLLRRGVWGTKPLVDPKWIDQLVQPTSHVAEVGAYAKWGWGYGRLWWVFEEREGPFHGAFTAVGAGGQYLTVIPALDMVVAHEVAGKGRDVPPRVYRQLLDLLAAARNGRSLTSPRPAAPRS